MEFSVEILKKALNGDQKAAAAIIEQYAPLVYRMVNKYEFMTRGHSREDLVQEGCLGIHKALKTYDRNIELSAESWMTWVFWKVRDAVQSAARKESKHPKYHLQIDSSGEVRSEVATFQPFVRDSSSDYLGVFSYCEVNGLPPIKNIIIEGCGSLDSKGAKIVCSRFGLLGQKPLRNSEVAKKFGLSKQSVTGYISRFSRIIRERHPEFAELVRK
jgi:hypothetical protein